MQSPAQKAIVIGMDGAAMELVQNMVDWGHMPNLEKLMQRGVKRPMIGVFPTLTPPGWTETSTSGQVGDILAADGGNGNPGRGDGPGGIECAPDRRVSPLCRWGLGTAADRGTARPRNS